MHHHKKHAQILCALAIGGALAIIITYIILPKQISVKLDAVFWFISLALPGIVLFFLVPNSAHQYLFVIVFGWLFFGVGLVELCAVFLWLTSAWSLGTLVLQRLYKIKMFSLIDSTEAIVVGAAIWLAVWGAMLHFAVNYQALHIVLSLLPCLFLAGRFSEIRNEFITSANAAQKWMQSIPFWAWVMGLAVVGWVLRWASFPSMGYDDHVQHLRIWTELLTQQRYAFDVSTQIWSVAPFAVDLLHAGLSLMAGSDARSAMNLGLAMLMLLLMAGLLRRWSIPVWAQWLLMVLMATTPMLGNLLLTLQTELMLSVVALAGLRLALDAHGGWRGQHVLGVLACAALCAAIKLPGAILGVALLASLMWRYWSQRTTSALVEYRLGWSALWVLVPLGFVALHSYVVAWKVTGNPVFPLYNAIFLSPYFDPRNFSDPRWIHGFSLASYARAFFDTSEFFESGDYTAGWQYLIMLPLAMLALLRPGSTNGLRIILIPLFGFGLVMFAATQYWRYLFPVMPLAGVLLGSLFVQEKRALRNTAFLLALACIATNLVFFKRVSWMMNSPASMAFTRDGKEALTSLYAPAAILTEQVNKLAPGSRVLYTHEAPYGATLHGSPLYVTWYQPARSKSFGSVKNFDGLRDLITKEKVDFAILAMPPTSGLQDVLWREYMAKYGYAEGQANNFLLYKIGDTALQYQKIFELQSSTTKSSEDTGVLIPMTGESVAATMDGKVLAVIPTHRANQARYQVEFNCPSASGYFVAQINWDKGSPYYRLVACEAKTVTFIEAIPIPIGANQGSVYVTARDTSSIQVKNITVEVN